MSNLKKFFSTLNVWYWVVIFGFCGIGIFNAFKPVLLSGFSIAGSGDTWLSNYLLEHSFQLLVNKEYIGQLWSPAFFFPYKGSIAFSENFWGSSPVYWIFRFVFLPDVSFHLWTIAVSALCFFSFFILSRNINIGIVLSALGSYLFAFGLPRIQQIGHPQLLPQFFTPLAFLSLLNFIKFPKHKHLALFLLFTYLQILSSIYLGWFLIFSLIIVSLIVYGFDHKARESLIRYLKKNYLYVAGLVLVWSGLILALIKPYLEVKKVVGDRSYSEIDMMLPRLNSWFLPAENSLWWQVLSSLKKNLPMYWEHSLFLGILPIVLTGLTAWLLIFRKDFLPPRRARLIQVCSLVALCIFVVSLRLPNGWSLWRVVYEIVPGASAIRAVTRIWTIFYFYLLIALLLTLDSLLSKVSDRKHIYWAILSVVCLVGIAEQTMLPIPTTPRAHKLNEIAEIQNLMSQKCDVAYVEPDANHPIDTHVSAMWAGLQANIPVVNGYSGNWPPNYPGSATDSASPYQITEWLQDTSMNQICMIVPRSQQEVNQRVFSAINARSGKSSQNFISWLIQRPFYQYQKFSQEIQLFEVPRFAQTDEIILVPTVIKNTSNFVWRSQGKTPTNFSYRWLDAKGQPTKLEGHRTSIPVDLPPGKSIAINAAIAMPTNPGEYKLVATMVQENIAWFDVQGAQAPGFIIMVKSPN